MRDPLCDESYLLKKIEINKINIFVNWRIKLLN